MRSRARLSGLAMLCMACAAYGSFVPLRWRSIGWAEGWRRAVAIPLEPVWHVFNGDFFTNVLVFLPIGFFAAGAIAPGAGPTEARDHRRSGSPLPWVVVGSVLIGSALLSMLIELGQVYVRDRTPSWSDVYAQALGGMAGAVFWVLVGGTTLHWVSGALRASSRDERVLRLLGLYAAGWTAYGLLPTLFPELAHPLLRFWTARPQPGRLLLAGPLAIAWLSAVPVGGYAALLSARAGWAAGLVPAVGVGLLVLADRVRQVSYMPADGHLAAGVLGFSCGWLLLGIGGQRMGRGSPARMRALFSAGLVALLALIALLYWAPFDFGVSAHALEQRIRVLYTRAPFHRYYWLPPLVALSEVVTLGLLSVATSVLVWLLGSREKRALTMKMTVAVTTLVFVIVEWGQLYLPARRADPTDLVIAVVGAVIGVMLGRALEWRPPPPPA